MARKVGLTRHDVVAAAARFADRDGLEHLTLQAIAAHLGVRSPSLYAHVDGRHGLLRLLAIEGAGRLASALLDASEGLAGDAALRAFLTATRTFARAHPGLYDAAQRAVRPGEDEEVYLALEEPVRVIAAVLSEQGHRPEEIIPLIRALRSAVHGFVELERRAGFGMPDDVEASFATLVEVLLDGLRSRLA